MSPDFDKTIELIKAELSGVNSAASMVHSAMPIVSNAINGIGYSLNNALLTLQLASQSEYCNKVIRTLNLTELTQEEKEEFEEQRRLLRTFLSYHPLNREFKYTYHIQYADKVAGPEGGFIIDVKAQSDYDIEYSFRYFDEYWLTYIPVVALYDHLSLETHQFILRSIKEEIGYYPEPEREPLWDELFSIFDELLLLKPAVELDDDVYEYSSESKFIREGYTRYPYGDFRDSSMRARKVTVDAQSVLFTTKRECDTGTLECFIITPFDNHAFWKSPGLGWVSDTPKNHFDGYYLENMVNAYKDVLTYLKEHSF